MQYYLLILLLIIYIFNNTEHLNLGGIAPIRDRCKTYNKLKDKYYTRDHLNRKKYLWWDGKYDSSKKSPLVTYMGGNPGFLPREKYCKMFKNDSECYPPNF